MKPHAVEQLDNAAVNCMKCGFCKAACPLFLGEETTTPRAKVRLARAVIRGELDLSQGVKKQMERCLNCKACAAECPSGVEPNEIALMLRAAFVERDGLTFEKRLLFHNILGSPKVMGVCRGAATFVGSAMVLQSPVSPFRKLLPLFGLRQDRLWPLSGSKPLTSLVPEMIEPLGAEKTSVLYFPGCSTNYIYPHVGLAVISVLRKLGARVIMPHDLNCCSTPVFNSGDIEGARRLAASNIEKMASINADCIVTSCGSCGLTLKHEWNDILGLDTSSINKNVLDISEFVVRYVESDIKALDDEVIVTYHDPCHLNRGLGVRNEPRQLLKAILGGRYIEMDSADRCCGGGGAFSVYHDDLSQVVAETKVLKIREAGADVVATGCPACMMQLADSINHRSMQQSVVHTVEIIDCALRSTE